MLSGNYSGSYKIISVKPKSLLETQIFGKKGSLSVEKRFLVYFSRSIEHDKHQETYYKGPEGILTITVGVLGSILQDLRCR